MNAIVFVCQVLVTGRILRWFGIGSALLVLPACLMGGSAAILVYPVLWAAVFAKGADWGNRYSLDQSTWELLFLPLPNAVVSRVEPLVDMAGSRLTEGFPAVLLVLLTIGLSLSLRAVSFVAIGLAALWIIATVAVRREYIQLLGPRLDRADIDPERQLITSLDQATTRLLLDALDGPDESRVLAAFDLLALAKHVDVRVPAAQLLTHPPRAVQLRALRELSDAGHGEAMSDVEPLVESSNPAIQSEAVHFVCAYGPVDRERRMEEFMRDPNPAIRAAAIVCIARHGTEEHLLLGAWHARARGGR